MQKKLQKKMSFLEVMQMRYLRLPKSNWMKTMMKMKRKKRVRTYDLDSRHLNRIILLSFAFIIMQKDEIINI